MVAVIVTLEVLSRLPTQPIVLRARAVTALRAGAAASWGHCCVVLLVAVATAVALAGAGPRGGAQ